MVLSFAESLIFSSASLALLAFYQRMGATPNKNNSYSMRVYNCGRKDAKEEPRLVANGTARLKIIAIL